MSRRVIRSRAVRNGECIVHSTARYAAGTDNLESVLFDLLCYAADAGRDFDAALATARARFDPKRDVYDTVEVAS